MADKLLQKQNLLVGTMAKFGERSDHEDDGPNPRRKFLQSFGPGKLIRGVVVEMARR